MLYQNFDTNGNVVKSDVIAYAPVKITAAQAGDIIIKRASGVVVHVYNATLGLAVTLKDGGKEVWPALNGVDEDDFSQCPLQFGTSIVLSFGGAGTAYIAYR